MQYNCPEDRSKMQKVGGGFNCEACSRVITDFRGMSNEEIMEVIRQRGGKTCGILRSSQVINPVRSNIETLFRAAFVFVFLLGLSTTSAIAQDTLEAPTAVIDTNAVSKSYIVSGTLKDEETLEPLVFAQVSVMVGGKVYGAVTDFDGKYKIEIPEGFSADQKLELQVRYVGYQTLIVEDLEFKELHEVNYCDLELKLRTDHELAGYVIILEERLLIGDPYDFNKTVIEGDDLRRY